MYIIQIDNLLFHTDVTKYSPAIPGSYSYNADSDIDYYGYSEEIEWTCLFVDELLDNGSISVEGKTKAEIVDAYAEQITDKLLDIIKFEQECNEEYYV